MTGMGKELPGRWIVSDEDYPRFLDLFHDYLFVKNARPLNLVEQPRVNQPKPLLIDLDFRYSSDQAVHRTFTNKQIEKFCKFVLDGLKTFFEIDSYEMLHFFVTLRPAPYQEAGKKERKDGVHIECPDICLSNEKQKVLRAWLLSHNCVSKAFANTNYTNSDADVYDESMVRKQGWFFFGESKPTIARYDLAFVMKYNPEEEEFSIQDKSEYTNRELMELLSVRFNLVDDDNVVREEAQAEYQGLLNPVATVSTNVEQEPEETNQTNNDIEVLTALRDILIGTERTEEEQNIVKLLVRNCLSPERADKYESWIRVGWCLHNIEPSEDMFNLWMEFSAKSTKSSLNNVSELRRDWFGRMRKEGDGPRLTELALRKWARDDNPVEYKRIIDADILEYILHKVDTTHFHVAQLMKKLYQGNYVASIGSKTTDWYFYDDKINMWKHLNQGIQLRKNISFEVAEYIFQATQKKQKQLLQAGKDLKDVFKDTHIEKLIKTQQSLYSTTFTDSTMKMAANFFMVEDFQNKLDSNVFLFGCKNGVLELRAKTTENPREHVIFRDGRPEDYVSFLAGQNLPDSDAITYTPFDELNAEQLQQLEEIKDFFSKIIPRPDLRAYVLRLLSSCLEGANREQCYYTFIGAGGNGKSKLMDLCRLTFGDYWSSLQTTVLTGKRPQAGNANPELICIKNKRFISMQEPEERAPINTSIMKQFSGEDIIEARGLFKDQERFKITGKLFMMCNRLPPVNSMDNGTWRRIRVVPFEAKFVTAEDPDYKAKKPNVFLRDPELDNKLRIWREVFLSWLVHIYDTEYIPTGLEPIPDIVKKESADYKESFDTFAKFRNERIRKATGEKTTFKAIMSAYTMWKSENRRGTTLTPKELQNRLNDEFGDPDDGKTYNHIIVFGQEYDVEEWDKNNGLTTA